MAYSYGTLLWIVIMFRPWVEAAVSRPQNRAFRNSSDVTPTTSANHPTLSIEAESLTIDDEEHSVPESDGGVDRMIFHSSINSDGNTVVFMTGHQTPDSTPTSTSNEATTASFGSALPSINEATKWHNTSAPYPTETVDIEDSIFELVSIPFITDDPGAPSPTSDCTPLAPEEPYTVWLVVPNTTVATLTMTANYSTALPQIPEFTPPVYCPDPDTLIPIGLELGTLPADDMEDAIMGTGGRRTVTVITTSKNPAIITQQPPIPNFGGKKTDRKTVDPATQLAPNPPPHWNVNPTWSPPQPLQQTVEPPPPPTTTTWSSPGTTPPPKTEPPPEAPETTETPETPPETTTVNGDHAAKTRVTHVMKGMMIVVSPTQAVIGQQVVDIGSQQKIITEGGDVFTVGPDKVEGPSFVIKVPTYAGNGGSIEEPPEIITVQGIAVQVGPTGVVIKGDEGKPTTIPIVPGAAPTMVVVQGQNITVGSGGIGFSGTTITPPPHVPTNVVVVGGQGFSAIGNAVAVIGGKRYVYGPGTAAVTVVLNGEAITVGPQGVNFDGTTIGGPDAPPTGTRYAMAGGLSISEIGSNIAVINGVKFIIGPDTTPKTTVVGGQTVIAGPNGLVVGGATLDLPFNPVTKAFIAGGIKFTQIGAAIAVIGGSTYSFGPGAPQTNAVIAGQTISIGPGGIGFGTTTLTAAIPRRTGTGAATATPTAIATATPTATATGKSHKSGAGRVGIGAGFGVLGVWIPVAVCCSVWFA